MMAEDYWAEEFTDEYLNSLADAGDYFLAEERKEAAKGETPIRPAGGKRQWFIFRWTDGSFGIRIEDSTFSYQFSCKAEAARWIDEHYSDIEF